MSVYDNLRQILSSRYGKDVRQSIHDAIQQCYSDATGNPESVAAFADEILALQAEDTNINTIISGLQTTITSMQSTITSMQTTISGQFNKFYPIGSLYVTGDDTFDPNEAEGWQGTWAKIEGRFILGSSDDYEVNNVGGEAKHTLTINEIPSHSHYDESTPNKNLVLGGNTLDIYGYSGVGATESQGFQWGKGVWPEGGGQAHNNMPPYEVKHIWERTA